MDIVSVVKSDGKFLAECIRKGISLIGGWGLGNVPVIIKPNLCTETDVSGGATVSSKFVKVVIDEIIREREDSTIKIVESDSRGKYIDKAFENLGFLQLVNEYRNYDVSLVNLSKERATLISKEFGGLRLPDILLEPNIFISIGKAKTSGITGVTGVLKNQFGCLPEKNKVKYHRCVDDVIAFINKIILPDLCIVDGIIGMEGSTMGKIGKLGVLIFGYSPVSVDATMTRVLGIDPLEIKHILISEKYGLGSINPRIVGEQIESVVMKFRKPSVSVFGKYIPETLYPIAKKIYRLVGDRTL